MQLPCKAVSISKVYLAPSSIFKLNAVIEGARTCRCCSTSNISPGGHLPGRIAEQSQKYYQHLSCLCNTATNSWRRRSPVSTAHTPFTRTPGSCYPLPYARVYSLLVPCHMLAKLDQGGLWEVSHHEWSRHACRYSH